MKTKLFSALLTMSALAGAFIPTMSIRDANAACNFKNKVGVFSCADCFGPRGTGSMCTVARSSCFVSGGCDIIVIPRWGGDGWEGAVGVQAE